MDMQLEVKEYNVLGHNIRLKESNDEDTVSPDEVVNFVNGEINAIKQSAPNLADSQVAVLVALKLAQEKLSLERDFKHNINSLQKTAREALKLVEEVAPTTH
jgi:cell division protein ZapA